MKQAINKIKLWRNNPVQFVRDVFGAEPDAWQAEGLMAFANPNTSRIAFSACAGPGKSTILSWAAWNFLACYADHGEHPKGAAVSITASNLRDNLWAELSKWQSRSPFLLNAFKWTSERIFAIEHPQTWFISARSFAQSANSEEIGRTLSGLHSKYVLYLIDESGDIPASIGRSAEQGLGTEGLEFGKILQAGNPTSHTGLLYNTCTKKRDLWKVINITGDPDDPNRSPRINIDWAREQIAANGGRDNDWVKAYILGQFPDSSINTLLSLSEVEAAVERGLKAESFQFAQKRLGVDVALGGLDKTVIFPRQGLCALKPEVLNLSRPSDIAAKVMRIKADWGSEMEFVDNTGGFGSGVVDSLLQAGIAAQGIHFSSKPLDFRYVNMRTYMWFEMRDWIRRGGSIPNDPELIKQLTTPVHYLKGGKIALEEKDQIKKRLGFSPDKADALALTFSMPDMPASVVDGVNLYPNRGKLLHDYDPFQEK